VARASCPCMAVVHSPTAAAGSGISSRVVRDAYGVNRDSSGLPPPACRPAVPAEKGRCGVSL
jgi:hypothetical protein